MKWGIVFFSVCSGFAIPALATEVDPAVVEARRQMVDFALKNPGASSEQLRGKFDETIGAAEKKSQDKSAGIFPSKSQRKKKARKGTAQTPLTFQEDGQGKLRVLKQDGAVASSAPEPRGAGDAKSAASLKSKRDGDSPHDDPSPLPFTGPRSLDFRSSPKPSPSPSPAASDSPSL